jgi:hypothetical protein
MSLLRQPLMFRTTMYIDVEGLALVDRILQVPDSDLGSGIGINNDVLCGLFSVPPINYRWDSSVGIATS